MPSTHKILLLIATILISAPALAAEKYDVELIIFERTSQAAGMNETWPEDPGKPDLEHATHLTDNGLYASLPNSRRTLNGVAKQMQRASGRPVQLTHIMWRQPAAGKPEAVPIFVSGSTRSGTMTGTVKVYVQRYLHMDLDLLLQTNNGPSPGVFRMQEHRRMKSKELHYIDHPMLGALVRITPVQ